jgi:hypothetical protein
MNDHHQGMSRKNDTPSHTDRPVSQNSTNPARQNDSGSLPSTTEEISSFLAKVDAAPASSEGAGRGRLIFAMDATMSRQPSWDRAQHIQADMFHETAKLGGLDVQLVYFRGFHECRASGWVAQPQKLARLMNKVECRGGYTQINRVLKHSRAEHRRHKVGALVYVGDCMEESVDELCAQAGELGLCGLPVFVFHEGGDRQAALGFEEIARLSGGVCCAFDSNAPDKLRSLLASIAVYASGGLPALKARGKAGNADARMLLEKLGRS